MKELFPGIFQIDLPIGGPLKNLNLYLLSDKEKCIIIDTGMPHAFIRLRRELQLAGVKPQDLSHILVTHFHIDHIGLVSKLKKLSNAKIIFHEVEAELSESPLQIFWKGFVELYAKYGAPGGLCELMDKMDPGTQILSSYDDLANPWMSLRGGEEISVGDYCFQVIHTPGHTPGHISLYEPSLRVLIGGDHLLPRITPNVTFLVEDSNPLADYLNSLEKVEKMDIDLVLPGHEEIFENHKKRIREIRAHHEQRAEEIIALLQEGPQTGYQITSRLTWDVDYEWDSFPPFQKWLAIGEALAHLRFLESQTKVKKVTQDNIFRYELI